MFLREVGLKSTLLSLSAGKYLAKSFFLFIHSLTLFSIKSTTVIYIMYKCVNLDELIIILIDSNALKNMYYMKPILLTSVLHSLQEHFGSFH